MARAMIPIERAFFLVIHFEVIIINCELIKLEKSREKIEGKHQ